MSAKKVLLRFEYGHDQRNDRYPGNNKVSAKLVTYDEAVEQVRRALVALPDPSPLPKLPADATSILYFDGNEEDGNGMALVWGDYPTFSLGETPSGSPALIVDGKPYDIEDFEQVIDRDPDEADRLRAEQESEDEDEGKEDDEDEDEDKVGNYTLTLTYADVPRSEVEHTAEDCTHNGDYPADSYNITED